MINKTLLDQVEACRKCRSIVGYEKFPQTSHGKLDSKYMLLSEAPGGDSITKKQYWKGSGGNLLRGVMQTFGKQLEDVFFMTDIVKCWPNDNGKNRKPTDEEIANCFPFLALEVGQLKPCLILALGKKAAESVLGASVSMKGAHGKVYESRGTKVLVMYHPSQIDLSMNRGVYTKQLRNLFERIVDGEGTDFGITSEPGVNSETMSDPGKADLDSQNPSEMRSSFVLPAPGNSITAKDIKKGYLRVTADFKRYFPTCSKDVLVTIANEERTVRFEHRGRRSHLLKIGSDGVGDLGISEGSEVSVEIISVSHYRLRKLS